MYFYKNNIPTRNNCSHNSDDDFDSLNWRKSFDKGFQIGFYSSNNPRYFTTRGGYYFCQQTSSNENRFELFPSKFIVGHLNEICGSVFIPRTAAELEQAIDALQNFNPTINLEQLRINTDYQRTNKSYLWSETAKSWWNLKNESQGRISK